MNTIDTITGAGIAALISFGNALLALFMNDTEMTFDSINQAAWVGILVGSGIQFLKDYQALSTRRVIQRMREPSGTARSPAIVGVFAVVVLFLSGCGSLNNVFGGAALTVTGIADRVRIECGNTAPGGPCLATSRITTQERDDMKIRLQSAQDSLVQGNELKRQGDTNQGATWLQRSNAILTSLEALLIARGIE